MKININIKININLIVNVDFNVNINVSINMNVNINVKINITIYTNSNINASWDQWSYTMHTLARRHSLIQKYSHMQHCSYLSVQQTSTLLSWFIMTTHFGWIVLLSSAEWIQRFFCYSCFLGNNFCYCYWLLWVKNGQMLTNFKDFFTIGLSSKFVLKSLLKTPTHLKCVAALPCEIFGTFLT